MEIYRVERICQNKLGHRGRTNERISKTHVPRSNKTYRLDDTMRPAGLGNGHLTVRVRQPGHGGGADEEGSARVEPEDLTGGPHLFHVAQHPRPQHQALVHLGVSTQRDEVGRRGRVEGVRLRGVGPAGDLLKVVHGDQTAEGRLGVFFLFLI